MSSPSAWRRFNYWMRVLARFVLIVAFSVYATAKFVGAQFVSEGGVLDKPVADLSGIELTWVFFGYSALFSNIVAGGQLAAAALLAFDRTARLGAVVLLPMTVNIVAVNFGFHIGRDTQIVSSILLALNLWLLAGDLPVWKKCFWDETAVDPSRPRLMGVPAAGVIRGLAFAAIAGGLYALFAIMMNGPAGGRSPASGEWQVESITVDGRRTADPALGAGWRWVCFDPFGRLSVRTNGHTFEGRYDVEPVGDTFSVRYDPVPLPPVYPGQSVSALGLSPAEEIRIGREAYSEFRWPIELAGMYRMEGGKLFVSVRRGDTPIEWILSPYQRPKW